MTRLLGPDVFSLAVQAGPIIALTTVAATVPAMVRAWFNYLRMRTREQEVTARLKVAIADAPPERRSEIIESCGRLEASAGGNAATTPRGLPRRVAANATGRRNADRPRAKGANVG